MDMHDHSIAWMIAGGSRSNEARDRAFLRAIAEARSADSRPDFLARIRARFDRGPVDSTSCCISPSAA
jgi:hypothetical protein